MFGVLYWASAEMMYRWPDKIDGEKMYLALFAILWGLLAAAQSGQFGPDIGKAAKAALKIFQILDRPSEIDALDVADGAVKISDDGKFRGEIEFRDVWFRYPTRPEEWVFKGLNLMINQNDTIAVVGESGSGKSTFINLVMRFYDPEFGQVLIDGVDVKDYDVRDLRRSMGLVMQEPTLFNYTIKENVLYGKPKASNEEINAAVKVANAAEFIESDELKDAFDTDAKSLLEAYKSERFREQIID